ncbi:hypothetical protein WN943_027778 [Citrus x changshan-huyou]
MYQPLAVTVSHFLCTQILDLRAESSGGGQSKAVVDRLKEPLALPKHEEGWRLNLLKPIGHKTKQTLTLLTQPQPNPFLSVPSLSNLKPPAAATPITTEPLTPDRLSCLQSKFSYDSDAPEEFAAEQGLQQDEGIRKVQKENKARILCDGKERQRLWAQNGTPLPSKVGEGI